MWSHQIKRLFDAYPAIYLACHRRHVRDDESGAVITAHQATILDHLDVERPTTVSRLAEHLGIGRSAMSIQVSQLVRRGYIRRAAVEEDGRKIGLTLTGLGNRVKSYNTVLDLDLVKTMFAFMPKSELETALQGIELLAKYARILIRRKGRKHVR